MKIQTKMHQLCLNHFDQKRFYAKNLRLFSRRGVSVETVEIVALAITAKIAIDYAIRIDHWHYVKNKVLEKGLRLLGA